jgi:hypothetical protein
MNYTDRQSPIRLRPAPDAVFAQALRSLSRAALVTARRVHEPSARNPWRDDADVELVMRGAVSPTSTTNAAALATVKLALLAALQPVSAAAQVIAKSMGLSFDGALTIGIPSLSLPNARWVAEGAPIPVAQGISTAGSRIYPYKLGIIVSMTREMIESSSAESITRQLLVESTGPVLDQALFSASAGVAGLHPPGLLFNIPPLTASTGSGFDAMLQDVGSLVQAVAPVSGAGQPLIVAAPKQATAIGMAARDPLTTVLSSAALPVGTVVAVVPQALVSVVETPRLDASSEAGSLHMEDTAPAEIVDGSGVFAKPVMSIFQMDSVALRMTLPASWGLRSPLAAAWIQSATW